MRHEAHLDPVAHIVQHVVVDGLPDVSDRPLHVGRGDDLVGPRRVLVGGEDPDLSPGHLLLVDVHRLNTWETEKRHDKCLRAMGQNKDH